MKANHHGTKDSTNEEFLKVMNPSTIIFQCCEQHHPSTSGMDRVLKTLPDCHLFATSASGRPLLGEQRWNEIDGCGHIVIRAHADGSYKVYVLDASDPEYKVKATFVF